MVNYKPENQIRHEEVWNFSQSCKMRKQTALQLLMMVLSNDGENCENHPHEKNGPFITITFLFKT